jgi:hypothetical protein
MHEPEHADLKHRLCDDIAKPQTPNPKDLKQCLCEDVGKLDVLGEREVQLAEVVVGCASRTRLCNVICEQLAHGYVICTCL